MKHEQNLINTVEAELLNFCKNNYSKKDADFRQNYLKTNFKCYGISAPQLRNICKDLQNKFTPGLGVVIELVNKLWIQKIVELRMASIYFLEINLKKLDITNFELIEKMVLTSTGWWELDEIAIRLVGGLIKKNKSVLLHLPIWTESPNFWARRAAIISQIELFRKGDGDLNLFENLLKNQLSQSKSWVKDEKFFMEKAIGWSLRELSKSRPRKVVEIINNSKINFPKLSFKEATKRLKPSYLHLLKTPSY